jgi:hypothetical protein
MKFIYYLSETKYFVTDLYRADSYSTQTPLTDNGWVCRIQPNRRLPHRDDEAVSQETIDCKDLEFLRLFQETSLWIKSKTKNVVI